MTETASWVIVDRQTGKAVFETFNAKTKDAINLKKYKVLPILEWLVSLNNR